MHLHRNEVSQNGQHGVFLRDAWDTRLTDNAVYWNMRAGVRINGGRDIAVRGNAILHNLADGKTRQSEVFLDEHDGAGPHG